MLIIGRRSGRAVYAKRRVYSIGWRTAARMNDPLIKSRLGRVTFIVNF